MSEKKVSMPELLKEAGDRIKQHDNRQDYLAGVARYIESDLTEEEFDGLTDEAASWYNDAVDAINTNLEIPDFVEGGDDSQDTGDEGIETHVEAETTTTGSDGGDLEPSSDAPRKAKKSKRGDSDSSPKKAGKAKEDKAGPEAPKPDKSRPDYASLTGAKDRYGVVMGTKTHEAVMMYEKGCTSAQLMDELGGRFYNILTKLGKEGHHIEKLNGGVWKLIHKDDFGKKAKGK